MGCCRAALVLALVGFGLSGCGKESGEWYPPPAPDSAVNPQTDGPRPGADGPRADGPRLKQDGPALKQDGPKPKLDGPKPKLDGPKPKLDGPLIKPDTGKPPAAYKVAAIQYGSDQYAMVSGTCTSTSQPTPDVCALRILVGQAKSQGAYFVILPEYGTGQASYEPTPVVGENPATSSSWPSSTIIKTFSLEAKQRGIYLVLNLLTYEGQKPSQKYYNVNVAFDPTGKVVGVHKKFNLFGSENNTLTAGTGVSVFSTPLGKIGMLICADIYGSSTLRSKLVNQLQAHVVMVSSYWTTSGATSWYKTFAKSWAVYTAVANTTNPPGVGGGIYTPTGATINEKVAAQPSVVVGTIPVGP